MKWGAVIGGVALAALASMPASAADMTVSPRRVPISGYIPAQFFWTGFYIGAGVGGGWGTSTITDPFNGSLSVSPSLKGVIIDGVSGINYQINSWVLGVEANFDGPWIKGSTSDVPPAPALPNSLKTEVLWTASVTGRVGMAFDRLLVFGKGGVGFDNDRDTIVQGGTGVAVVGSIFRAGWTIGGGVEYAVTEHWTGRLEYDYFRFPARGLTFQGNTALTQVGGTVGLNLGELKGVMSYKF
jgi:outer membrane immunogenic protein